MANGETIPSSKLGRKKRQQVAINDPIRSSVMKCVINLHIGPHINGIIRTNIPDNPIIVPHKVNEGDWSARLPPQ